MKTELLQLANALRGRGLTRTKAFKLAWATFRLKASMTAKPTRFVYQKETGEIREAIGYYGENHLPQVSKSPALTVKYFDLRRNAWRSFRTERLIIS